MRTMKKENPVEARPAGVPLVAESFRRRVAERAYELFLKHGQTQGHDLDDWLEAERLVTEEIATLSTLRSDTPRVESPRSTLNPGRRHPSPGQKAHPGRR